MKSEKEFLEECKETTKLLKNTLKNLYELTKDENVKQQTKLKLFDIIEDITEQVTGGE